MDLFKAMVSLVLLFLALAVVTAVVAVVGAKSVFKPLEAMSRVVKATRWEPEVARCDLLHEEGGDNIQQFATPLLRAQGLGPPDYLSQPFQLRACHRPAQLGNPVVTPGLSPVTLRRLGRCVGLHHPSQIRQAGQDPVQGPDLRREDSSGLGFHRLHDGVSVQITLREDQEDLEVQSGKGKRIGGSPEGVVHGSLTSARVSSGGYLCCPPRDFKHNTCTIHVFGWKVPPEGCMGCRDVPGASQPRHHPLDSHSDPERAGIVRPNGSGAVVEKGAESLGNGDLSPETPLSDETRRCEGG